MKTELMRYDRKMAEELWLELVKLHEKFKVDEWFVMHMKAVPSHLVLVIRDVIPLSVLAKTTDWMVIDWKPKVWAGNHTYIKYLIP